MMGYDMPMHEGRDLPQFTLREGDLPEVRSMEVGNTKYLIVKVEMIGKRSMKMLTDVGAPKSDAQKMEGDFQVHSIKCLGNTPVDAKTLESKDFQRTVAKVKSGEI